VRGINPPASCVPADADARGADGVTLEDWKLGEDDDIPSSTSADILERKPGPLHFTWLLQAHITW
jgi:hypothetical protein